MFRVDMPTGGVQLGTFTLHLFPYQLLTLCQLRPAGHYDEVAECDPLVYGCDLVMGSLLSGGDSISHLLSRACPLTGLSLLSKKNIERRKLLKVLL